MNNLSSFLNQNALKADNVKVVISKRFIDENGKPEVWELQSITSTDEERLRKSCTKRVQVPGKRGQYMDQMDQSAFIQKMAVACTVHPNLNDAELQNSYGVMGEEGLLMEMLLPGEYAELVKNVQEVTGYDISFEEKVDEAKN